MTCRSMQLRSPGITNGPWRGANFAWRAPFLPLNHTDLFYSLHPIAIGLMRFAR
jgi:hypothetical protein